MREFTQERYGEAFGSSRKASYFFCLIFLFSQSLFAYHHNQYKTACLSASNNHDALVTSGKALGRAAQTSVPVVGTAICVIRGICSLLGISRVSSSEDATLVWESNSRDQVVDVYWRLGDYEQQCAPCDSRGCPRSADEILQSFCAQKRVCSRINCWMIDWSSPSTRLWTLNNLEEKIAKKYSFRRKCVKPLERAFGEGYVDELIAACRTEFLREQRQLEKERKKLAFLKHAVEKQNDKKSKKRLMAIEKAFAKPMGEERYRFELSDRAKECLQGHIPIRRLEYYSGNTVQINIHEEIVSIVNEMSEISDKEGVEDVSAVVFSAADIALSCNHQKKYQRAYSFSDFCSSLLDVAKKAALVLPRGVFKGMCDFSTSCKTFLDCFLYDPVESVKDVGIGIVAHLGSVARRFDEVVMHQGFVEYDFSLEHARKTWEQGLGIRYQKTLEHFGTLFSGVFCDPEKSAIEGVAFLTEMVLSFGLCDIGIAKATKLAQAFSTGVRNELTCLAAKARGAKSSQMPLATIVKESVEIFECVGKKAPRLRKDFVKTALEIVEENPVSITAEKSVAKAVKEVVKIQSEIVEQGVVGNSLIKKCMRYSYELRTKIKKFTFSEVATLEECEAMSRSWVGKDAVLTSDGTGLSKITKTQDYIIKRTYRFPDVKRSGMHMGKVVANFEEYFQACEGAPIKFIKNGHLIIKG